MSFLNHGAQQTFGGTSAALSIDRDFYPAENLKVLSFTLVMLYRARAPLVSDLS